MIPRPILSALLAATLSLSATAQQKSADPPGFGAAAEKDVQGLTGDDFAQRQDALKRLQALIADQIRQRAEIQSVLDTLQQDLARQQKALAVVTDEEAQAQVAGLLEMERGLVGWTIEVMGEPIDKRKDLLAWGLSKDATPILARAYSQKLRTRLEGVKQLAKLTDEETQGGASWTLSRLINDPENAVRAAAMAACWDRKPAAPIVDALWFRAVSGPLGASEAGGGGGMAGAAQREIEALTGSVKVDFPGGDPLDFDSPSELGEFTDSQLAGDVLIHLKSPLVTDRVKSLVEMRAKAGKDLTASDDPDWTLVTHRLVETYAVKEAIPLLAAEALAVESDEMGGTMNGRPFFWSRRTVAIGTLAKLIARDPADFQLIRAQDMGDPRGWTWAVEMNLPGGGAMGPNGPGGPNNDGVAVRAFYAWWKDHHAEFGVKEEPSSAGVPPERAPRGRGRGRVVPADVVPGAVIEPPATAPARAPAAAPASQPVPETQPDALLDEPLPPPSHAVIRHN